MIEGVAVIKIVVWIIVTGLIFGLLWWLIDYAGLPKPFNKAARVILAVLAVVFLISLLLSFAGYPLLK